MRTVSISTMCTVPDLSYYESFVRNYYRFQGTVASVDQGMDDANIVVATSWPTAYPVYNARCAGKRFYLVQDSRALLLPRRQHRNAGGEHVSNGLPSGLSIGECYAKKLTSEYGMARRRRSNMDAMFHNIERLGAHVQA